MPEEFRFSPRPNRAHEIEWRPWGAAVFDEAREADRPVLLNLTAVWCHYCHEMDETTYSDESLIELINGELIPIRVDADRHPHVEQRYIAGGWPTNAILTPTGEVLWAGTYVPAHEFRNVATSVLTAWRDRREHLDQEAQRRRRAMEAARSQKPALGLVRREAADDVLAAMQETFDARNGGFDRAPKFPRPFAVATLFLLGRRTDNPDWLLMAERSLDGMLAGELRDPVAGGFFRYATAEDWTQPRYEKLLEVNAELVRVYALGAHLVGRDDWRRTVEDTVEWAERTLARSDGLWAGSQDADPEYYGLDAEARDARDAPFVDPVVYTDRNAAWARALAEAGARLGRDDWIERAAGTLDGLLETMATADGLFYHYRAPEGEPAVPGLLTDALETANACVTVAQTTGRSELLDRAREITAAMKRELWADDGGFYDHVPGADDKRAGALRYRDRPFELNAGAARLLIDLSLVDGGRSYRALAERILAVLSPLAGRYGVQGALFALAVNEFFEPPLQVAVVGPRDETAPLRRAALALPEADRRVWSLEEGGRVGAHEISAERSPTAYVCDPRSCSSPVRKPDGLPPAVDSLR